ANRITPSGNRLCAVLAIPRILASTLHEVIVTPVSANEMLHATRIADILLARLSCKVRPVNLSHDNLQTLARLSSAGSDGLQVVTKQLIHCLVFCGNSNAQLRADSLKQW